jgi:hypothetical protein
VFQRGFDWIVSEGRLNLLECLFYDHPELFLALRVTSKVVKKAIGALPVSQPLSLSTTLNM